jgi:hypothetical protein
VMFVRVEEIDVNYSVRVVTLFGQIFHLWLVSVSMEIVGEESQQLRS